MATERKTNSLTAYGRLVKSKLLDNDDMDQVKLAKRVGVHPVYLSRMLRGERAGKKYIPAINAELGISTESTNIRKVV